MMFMINEIPNLFFIENRLNAAMKCDHKTIELLVLQYSELQEAFVRTLRIYDFYGLCRIGYGYIDYFLAHIKVPIRFYKSV